VSRSLFISALLPLALVAAGAVGFAQSSPGHLRTAKHRDARTTGRDIAPVTTAAPPASSDVKPVEIARAYVARHAADFGLTTADVADVIVVSSVRSQHSGVTHVYLRQRYKGVEVHGAEMNVNVAKDGGVFGAGTSFVPRLATAITGSRAELDGVESAAAASRHLGRSVKRATPTKLVYEPLASGEVALAWVVSVEEEAGNHLWEVTVDASTGELFEQTELTVHDVWNEPDWNEVTADAAATLTTAEAADDQLAIVPVPGVPGSGTYKVYAWPSADPNDGPRSLVVDPADALSSPFGWHDSDGLPGPESAQTLGNNVEAYVDVLNDNVGDDTERATGVGGAFDFPIDLTGDPNTYQQAAVSNLFYWTNFIHDVSYRYGFTEDAGNFQTNNYGRFTTTDREAPPDSLRAEAQDGSGMDNSNFTTAADNALFPRPRMQLFLWAPVGGYEVQVSSNTGVIRYPAVRANFRPFLSDSAVVQPTATVQLAVPNNGCGTFTGFTPGNIAYVDSGGTCGAGTGTNSLAIAKARNARNAGAVGIIINTGQDGALLTPLAGVSATAGIPVLGISTNTAALLRPTLPVVAKMAFVGVPAPLRETALDASVILHEYTHGISNRLTGGPVNVLCLSNAEQMGEGWSDWMALALTHDPSRPNPESRAIGPYLRFTNGEGPGVRPTRYSRDLTENPATYDRIKSGDELVAARTGYVWASMLWEVYWNLIDKHGFNPNVYEPWNTGGNNLAIQLVTDGMKIQPCSPGFVTGRDAILKADQYLTGGANQCAIWRGFAKRGLGFSASQGSSASVTDGTEKFDMPPLCQPSINVAPQALAATLVQNRSGTDTLQITNVTAEDGLDLNWTVTEAATDCSVPVDLPWITVSPLSGTTPRAATSSVTVTFDATGAPTGAYSGKLCIGREGQAPTEVPVSLQVEDDIHVAPAALAASVIQNRSATETLQITNVTGASAFDVSWTITEAATDCSAPSDLPWVSVAPSSGTTVPAATSSPTVTFDASGVKVGAYTGKLCVGVAGQVAAEISLSVQVQYDFTGFFGELAGPSPEVNAGNEAKVEFSLNGDQGVDIFAAGYPASQPVECRTRAPLGAFAPAVSRRRPSVEYSRVDDEYRWRWQTSDDWKNTCRLFVVRFAEGTERSKFIRFK